MIKNANALIAAATIAFWCFSFSPLIISRQPTATKIALKIMNKVLTNGKISICRFLSYLYYILPPLKSYFEYGSESGIGSTPIFFLENQPKNIQAITKP